MMDEDTKPFLPCKVAGDRTYGQRVDKHIVFGGMRGERGEQVEDSSLSHS